MDIMMPSTAVLPVNCKVVNLRRSQKVTHESRFGCVSDISVPITLHSAWQGD